MTTTKTVPRAKKGVLQVKPIEWKAIRFRLTGLTPMVQSPRRRKCFVAEEGWHGIPAFGIRQGLLQAGKFYRGLAKFVQLSLFVEPDGFDATGGEPLARITKGTPRPFRTEHDKQYPYVFAAGWEANLVLRFDSELFKSSEVIELLQTAGEKVGIGHMRPDCKTAHSKPGWGNKYGTFSVEVD